MDADLYQVTYIVTFFSHFGAVRYKQLCGERGISCRMMPVPRDLSSSCGTCVYFIAENLEDMQELHTPELEQLVSAEAGYTLLYKVED